MKCSFDDVFRICLAGSKFNRYFDDLFGKCCSEWGDTAIRKMPLGTKIFQESVYVEIRDLSCLALGRSIREVLATLLLSKEFEMRAVSVSFGRNQIENGDCFCGRYCSCTLIEDM